MTAKTASQPETMRAEISRMIRRRILDAALRLFRDHGYKPTTIRQIAAAAGTTHTTLYQYFKGKAAIVLALGDETYKELAQLAKELDNLPPDSYDAVHTWVEHYTSMWRDHHAIFDAYWEAAYQDEAVAADIFPFIWRMTEDMPNLLGRFKGAARERVRHKVALSFVFLYQTSFLTQCAKSSSARAALLEDYTDMLWNSLRLWQVGEQRASSVTKKARARPQNT